MRETFSHSLALSLSVAFSISLRKCIHKWCFANSPLSAHLVLWSECYCLFVLVLFGVDGDSDYIWRRWRQVNDMYNRFDVCVREATRNIYIFCCCFEYCCCYRCSFSFFLSFLSRFRIRYVSYARLDAYDIGSNEYVDYILIHTYLFRCV